MNMREIVEFRTSKGNFQVELDRERAPITVENFLRYVNQGHYDGTAIHRIVAGFVAQGGGYTPGGKPVSKPLHAPIKLESNNGLSNLKYTIAVPREEEPDSGREQFFFNLADNTRLDHSNQGSEVKHGYAVFGRIIRGKKVLDEIGKAKTAPHPILSENAPDPEHNSWPIEPILIHEVRLIKRK